MLSEQQLIDLVKCNEDYRGCGICTCDGICSRTEIEYAKTALAYRKVLEEAAEEIENCYNRETPLSIKIRDLLQEETKWTKQF